MNSQSTLNLILETAEKFGLSLIGILGTIILIGVGYLVYKVGWGYIRNMPGDWGYNSQRKSFRWGHGSSVKIKSGNLLE